MRSIQIVSILLAALLTACATQTKYLPADERGDYGYIETQLTGNRYRVTFTGNSLTPRETVQDYTLLRAAEVTLENGYDWFKIADRETDKKSRTTGGSSIGIGHHRGYHRYAHVSSTIGTIQIRDSYASSIEIVLGKDPMPEDMETYDAQELASTIRRWMSGE